MYDTCADSALDSCSDGVGCITRGRLVLKIAIAYVALAALCWMERDFRFHSQEVEGRIEIVGTVPKNNMTRVRYHFTDPVTHQSRMNTTALPAHLVPRTQTAVVQYIPGDFPSSRLKIETRSGIPPLFFWLNVVFGMGIVGFVSYLAWEAHRPIPRPKNRVRNYPLR